jgi:hypothetical protein
MGLIAPQVERNPIGMLNLEGVVQLPQRGAQFRRKDQGSAGGSPRPD